jgi:hypothetical protein
MKFCVSYETGQTNIAEVGRADERGLIPKGQLMTIVKWIAQCNIKRFSQLLKLPQNDKQNRILNELLCKEKLKLDKPTIGDLTD